MPILITGSAGLVGQPMATWLRERLGVEVHGFDLQAERARDVRDVEALRQAARPCSGIIHLAAVSRVIWGEVDPARCRQVNVEGTGKVLRAALSSPRRPWVIFASSREVYGQPRELPVSEDQRPRPINVYGRSKLEAEGLLAAARGDGLRTAIARLSNVYGRTDDHPDRVIPAFCRGAAEGGTLRIDGRGHTFDFTHVRDTVEGLGRMVEQLEAGEARLPPLHLLTGRATTLGELAELANEAGGGRCAFVDGPERSYDVARFWGDPSRAERVLGWRARVDLGEGVRELVESFAREQRSTTQT